MQIMDLGRIEVICPCCETKLQVDQKTGEIIWEEKKEKVMPSLSDMVKIIMLIKKNKSRYLLNEVKCKKTETVYWKKSSGQLEKMLINQKIFHFEILT